MGSTLMTYGALSAAASFALALIALMQRFGSAPTPAAQGTRVPAAAELAVTPNAHQTTVDRKADDRVPPRGRPL